MIYENINNLIPSMVVGKDIYDISNNAIILKEGTKLTEHHIEKLKIFGYKGIYIEDEIYKDIIIEDIIPNELKHKTINDLKDLNIVSTLYNARKIVNEIMRKSNISFDKIKLKKDDLEHSTKVAELSIVVGKAMGLNDEELVDLATAALLHDIGKFLNNSDYLKKLGFDGSIGTYKDELYPLYGYRLLAGIEEVKSPVRMAVLTHNMNEDGTNNLNINQPIKQNIYGKIIHVADKYEQVISNKYDDDLASPSEAMEFLLGGCGTKFNFEIVETFKKFVPIYPKGTKVILSNNVTGYVFKNNVDNPLRPCLILENGSLINLMDSQYINLTIINHIIKEPKKDITM